MNKITEIIQAWATAINPTDEQRIIAKIRLETCMGCEHWKENELGMHYCDLCGCLTKGKVFSPKGIQACPISKWKI
jgi:hypothetical protein